MIFVNDPVFSVVFTAVAPGLVYARRLQIQERMTAQIADDIMKYLAPQGVMVMLEAEHMCMTMRGIKKPGSQTVTMVTRGVFAENKELQDRFLQLVNR